MAPLCTDKECVSVSKSLTKLLENFGVDVILVAPACFSLVADFGLPPKWSSWKKSGVILEAKYVEALAVIRSQSWLYDESKFDGAA